MTAPTIKALWVGGPPGKTQATIRAKLRRDGIEVVLWAHDAVLPSRDVDVVLINKDMFGHTMFSKQRSLCKDAATPCVIVHTGYTQTRLALIREGFIDNTADVVITDDPETEEEDMAKTTPPPSTDDAGALRDFLLRLPPNLRSIAIDCVDDLKRKQEDEVVISALVGLLALAKHTDDALMRGVREMKAKQDGADVLRRLAGAIELDGLK